VELYFPTNATNKLVKSRSPARLLLCPWQERKRECWTMPIFYDGM